MQLKLSPALCQRFLDLTSLNETDTVASIIALCERAKAYQVAAVCIYPMFISTAVEALKGTDIAIASVANFSSGEQTLSVVLSSISAALDAGATEMDVVMPYAAFLASQDTEALRDFVRACKQKMPHYPLKIILETGAFTDPLLLQKAALACLEAGADFLKTSTGKIAQGASLSAASVLLHALQLFGDEARGFKASGGVRSYAEAKAYYVLAQEIMGETWPTPHTFRLGASSLLDDLIQQQAL